MILADATAWIEYLRASASPVDLALRALIAGDAPIATTDLVLMKVLAGARDDEHREQLRRLLARCEYLPTEAPADYERAADLYRHCRASGATVRRLPECVAAVVPIRHGLALLHAHDDFDAIARCAPLRIAATDAVSAATGRGAGPARTA